MLTIFRLEDDDGRGPFSSGLDIGYTDLIPHNTPYTMIRSDNEVALFEEAMSRSWVFGWSSEELYQKFFLISMEEIERKGFRHHVYKVEEGKYLILPDGQVVFERTDNFTTYKEYKNASNF